MAVEYKFFIPCPKSLPELKRMYHALALKYHPDHGGDEASMKIINNEYTHLFSFLKNRQENMEGEVYTSKEENNETPEQFIRIVQALINCDGLRLELCGSWLWASGNTMPYKERLKELSFFWCRGKKVWGFNFLPPKKKAHSFRWSMGQIREKFGSRELKLPTSKQLSGVEE